MKQTYFAQNSRRATGILLGSGLSLLLATPGLVHAQTLPQYSLPFNGTSQYVAVANRAALEFTTGTIEMWVKPNWAPGSHGGANVCLAAERPTNNSSTRFSLHMQNNLSAIGIWNGSSYSTRSYTFTKGQWYHVAFVMTSSDTEIFINGVSIGKTGNGINTTVTGANLCFGAANSTSTGELFEGELDEIRVWNTARTAAQISANMSAPVSAGSTGLLAYYPVDANVLNSSNATARLLKDYTSNSYNGTLYNYTYVTEANPTIASLFPTRNAISAARDANVMIGFSANMSSATASDAAIKVFGSQTGKRTGTFSGGGTNTITFNPTKDLKPGETASVTVTTAAATIGGTALAKPQVMQFTGATGGTGRGSFSGTQQVKVNGYPSQLIASDIDGDGDLDLLSVGAYNVSIRLNDGTGAFATPATNAELYVGNGKANSFAMADIDGDGDADMLVADDATIYVRLNDGTGVFTTPTTGAQISVSNSSKAIVAADIDGDGDLDLLTTSYNSIGKVSVRLNNGSGVFTTPATNAEVSVATAPLHLAVADIDGDGDLDLLTTSYNSIGKVSVRLNNGSGVFTTPATNAEVSVANSPYRIAMGDVNGDGSPDMAVCNVSTNTISLRLNNGNGVFTAPATNPEISIASPGQSVELVDVDADGDLDLLATVYNNSSVSIRLNNGKGVFTTPATNAEAGTIGSALLTAADIDNDGDLDLLASNNTINSPVQVLFNALAPVITGFTPGSGAAGTTVVLTGTEFAGATSVIFNGTAATSFTVNSATQITAMVPDGATTGAITVTTPAGTATSAQSFTVPVITDLVVSNGQLVTGAYRNVTITGTGVATLQGNVSVTGNFVVQNGGSLNIKGNAVTGNSFELQAGGTLTIGGREGIAATGSTGGIQTTTRSFSPEANYVYGSYQPGAVTGSGLPAQVRSLAVVDIYGDNETYLSLTNDLAIAQTLQLDYDLTTAGKNLTLLSTSTKGTALVVNNGGVVQGNVTVQRAIDPALNPGAGYRHFSSPVQNTTVADLATSGYSPVVNADYNGSTTPGLTQPYPTVFGYDAGAQAASPAVGGSVFDKGWVSPASVNDQLAVGRGYTVNFPASETADFVGTLNNGPISVPLTSGAGADAGWQLVGNPFPSPLDWNSMKRPQDIDDALYVYESNSQYQGSWRTAINGIGDPIVPTGQGFFVHLSNPNASTTLTFSNGARVTTFSPNPTMRRGTTETRPLAQLTLRGAGNSLTDDTYVYFQAEATVGVDSRYDALKIQHNAGGAPSLYSLCAGKELSISGLPAVDEATVIPLGVELPQAGTYTLEAAQLLNLPTTTVYLVDRETGQQVNLTQQPRYTFAATAAVRTNTRFELRFTPSRPLATQNGLTAASVSVYPNPAHGSLTVLVPAATGTKQVVATLCNALGQSVRQQTAALPAAGAQVSFDVTGLAAGVYVLRVQVGQSILTKQVVVN